MYTEGDVLYFIKDEGGCVPTGRINSKFPLNSKLAPILKKLCEKKLIEICTIGYIAK